MNHSTAKMNGRPSDDQVRQRAHDYTDGAADRIHNTIDDVAEKAEHWSRRAEDVSDETIRQARHFQSTVSDLVRNNPLAALGTAVAAGFVLNAILKK